MDKTTLDSQQLTTIIQTIEERWEAKRQTTHKRERLESPITEAGEGAQEQQLRPTDNREEYERPSGGQKDNKEITHGQEVRRQEAYLRRARNPVKEGTHGRKVKYGTSRYAERRTTIEKESPPWRQIQEDNRHRQNWGSIEGDGADDNP